MIQELSSYLTKPQLYAPSTGEFWNDPHISGKLLVFSDKPILEISLLAGYESQQAFTDIFRQMYKKSPNEYRMDEEFRFHHAGTYGTAVYDGGEWLSLIHI